MEPVVGKKWGEGSGGMFGVVVRKLRHRQKSCPIKLLVVGVYAQILLQDRIEALRLAIRLRMESSRPVGVDAQQLQQPTPKVAGEDGVAVADEAGG